MLFVLCGDEFDADIGRTDVGGVGGKKAEWFDVYIIWGTYVS